MKILVAPDKFKNSLTAMEVCRAIDEAIKEVDANSEVFLVPLADGGDGTCEVLTTLTEGTIHQCRVDDPLGREIRAYFGRSGDKNTAFVEMSSASGLRLLADHEKNPAYTSSVGTGQLILHALNAGVHKIVLGIGGSATNDAGAGMASALGVKFYDRNGKAFVPTGISLSEIAKVDLSGLDPRVLQTDLLVLCDVDNPLFGSNGAAFVFAQQKGADEDLIAKLDDGLRHFASLVQSDFDQHLDFPGAGAAGGVGAGAKFFLNAGITSGTDFLMKAAHLREKIEKSDLVITGEGKLDRQTLGGKVVSGICEIGTGQGKTVWVVCGINELSDQQVRELGIAKVIPLVDEKTGEKEAIRNAFAILREKVRVAITGFIVNP